MMKKTISFVLALMLMLSLIACGSKGDTADTKPQNSDSTQATTQSEEVPTETTVPKEETTGTVFQVPHRDIYFTADVDWTVDDDDFVVMLYENKARMVALSYDRISEFDGDYEKMVNALSKNFITEASSRCQGYIRNSTLEIISTEMINVSGYECMKFTGKINNDSNWDCHVSGYSYVVSGVKLMVIGIVSTPEQDAAMIAEIDALTDQVAASVRTEK